MIDRTLSRKQKSGTKNLKLEYTHTHVCVCARARARVLVKRIPITLCLQLVGDVYSNEDSN